MKLHGSKSKRLNCFKTRFCTGHVNSRTRFVDLERTAPLPFRNVEFPWEIEKHFITEIGGVYVYQ